MKKEIMNKIIREVANDKNIIIDNDNILAKNINNTYISRNVNASVFIKNIDTNIWSKNDSEINNLIKYYAKINNVKLSENNLYKIKQLLIEFGDMFQLKENKRKIDKGFATPNGKVYGFYDEKIYLNNVFNNNVTKYLNYNYNKEIINTDEYTNVILFLKHLCNYDEKIYRDLIKMLGMIVIEEDNFFQKTRTNFWGICGVENSGKDLLINILSKIFGDDAIYGNNKNMTFKQKLFKNEKWLALNNVDNGLLMFYGKNDNQNINNDMCSFINHRSDGFNELAKIPYRDFFPVKLPNLVLFTSENIPYINLDNTLDRFYLINSKTTLSEDKRINFNIETLLNKKSLEAMVYIIINSAKNIQNIQNENNISKIYNLFENKYNTHNEYYELIKNKKL